MSTPLRPRGPLPARVYWVRRLIVLGVAVVLVVVVAQLLRGGSDASDGEDTAARMSSPASETTETTESNAAVGQSAAPAPDDERARDEKREKERLAQPDGPCVESDIVVTPLIEEAEGGSDVKIRLALETEEAEACTWEVSAETLSLKVTSGSDLIWTSLECPRDLPTEDVVVRRDVATKVAFTWDARRSDDDCPEHTEWALPGTYHVTAAALAGEPTTERFELVRPTTQVVTKTVEPKSQDRDDERGDKPEGQRDEKHEGSEQAPTEHQAGEAGVSEPDG
jgi:hypothetical protein